MTRGPGLDPHLRASRRMPPGRGDAYQRPPLRRPVRRSVNTFYGAARSRSGRTRRRRPGRRQLPPATGLCGRQRAAPLSAQAARRPRGPRGHGVVAPGAGRPGRRLRGDRTGRVSTNMARLLGSKPDAASSLDGKTLVQRKVRFYLRNGRQLCGRAARPFHGVQRDERRRLGQETVSAMAYAHRFKRLRGWQCHPLSAPQHRARL